MEGVRADPAANGGAPLASCATLDYALMLARDVPGVQMGPLERTIAIDEALGNAVDDALALLRSLVARDIAEAKTFVAAHGLGRGMLATLGVLVRRPGVATTERRFSLVILTDQLAERSA